MGWLLGALCAGLGAVAVLVAASGLLRLSVGLANRLVKPSGEAAGRSGGIAEWDWDEWDDADGYDEPVRPWRAKPVIPEPGTLKAVGIVLGAACAFGIGFIVTGVFADELGFRMWREQTRLAVAVLNLPVAALALTLLLVRALPTGFWRAAMVAFVYGLVLLVFVAFIGLVVAAVALR